MFLLSDNGKGVLTELIEALEKEKLKVPEVETDIICSKCGRKMVIKQGRFGKFLACPGFPACRNTKTIANNPI